MGMYFVESVVNFGGYVEADSKEEAEEKGYYYDNLEYISVDSVEVTEEPEDEDDEDEEED